MRPKEYDFDPDNVDTDGVAEIQAVAGAGDLTLDGAYVTDGVATMDYARRLGILSSGNDAGITFTVTGTNANGNALVEIVTGAAGAPGTSETTEYFKTVTQIAASGAAAGNVTVGTVDEFASQIIPTDWRSDSGVAIGVTVTNTINYTVQETFDSVRNKAANDLQWHSISALAAKTASLTTNGTVGATAIRFVCNSYTNTAEVQMDISQPLGCN
jgi:hypothetical protein